MSPIPMKSRRHSHGFTLLEVMVVLLLATLLLTTVPPRLSAVMPGVEARSAIRELAASLRFARGRAIMNQEETVLVFDVARRRYRITGLEREHGFSAELVPSLQVVRSEMLSDTEGGIRFFPDGSSTGGRIAISAGKQEYSVNVDWLTGRVSYLD